MTAVEQLRAWASKLRRDAVTLWFAARHPGTPWLAKLLGAIVVAYALSPIDLIPDFIPVLGLLDDLILLPGLIWLALRMLPAPVLAECRARSDQWIAAKRTKPASRIGAAFVIAIWIAAALALWLWLARPGASS
ncbi:MAG: DUF1232 domain-containing protein [Burkholderiales bacterium]